MRGPAIDTLGAANTQSNTPSTTSILLTNTSSDELYAVVHRGKAGAAAESGKCPENVEEPRPPPVWRRFPRLKVSIPAARQGAEALESDAVLEFPPVHARLLALALIVAGAAGCESAAPTPPTAPQTPVVVPPPPSPTVPSIRLDLYGSYTFLQLDRRYYDISYLALNCTDVSVTFQVVGFDVIDAAERVLASTPAGPGNAPGLATTVVQPRSMILNWTPRVWVPATDPPGVRLKVRVRYESSTVAGVFETSTAVGAPVPPYGNLLCG